MLMNNKFVTVNWILAALVTAIAVYGYFIIANYTIEYGKAGYYESLEGYLFILVFTSPVLVLQLVLATSLIVKNIKTKQAKLSLLPLVLATIVPFGVAVVIG
jgi:uncharacterized membrane protein